MGQVARRTNADTEFGLATNMVSDLLANMRLKPSNYILNWRFDELNEYNDPAHFGQGLVMPEEPDTWWVFITDVNKGSNTYASHNTAGIALEDDYYDIDTPYVPGDAPTHEQFAALIAPPDFYDDLVEVIDVTDTGYEAGSYAGAYTWIRKEGKSYLHTKLSPATAPFTVGQSQHITWVLPTNPPESVTHIGLWLSFAGGPMRLQAVVEAVYAGSEWTLTGPYISRLTEPSSSQHVVTTPPAPRARRKQGTRPGRVGRYRARVTRLDVARGGKESTPSEWSNWMRLTEEDVENNISIEFDPENIDLSAGLGQTLQYRLYVQREDPDTLEIEDYVYVNPDGAGGTDILELDPKLDPTQAGRDSGGRAPNVSGRTEEQDSRDGNRSRRSGSLRRKRKKQRKRRRRRRRGGGGGGGEDGGDDGGGGEEEEQENVEDPSSPPEAIFGVGKVLITPGTYRVKIANGVRGERTLASPEVEVTIGTGDAIRVWFPDSIDAFRNSQWLEINSKGRLPGWKVTGADAGNVNHGQYWVHRNDGTLHMRTTGLKNNFATQATPDLSQLIEVSQDETWTFGANIKTNIIAGTVEAYLDEYNADNVLLRTTVMKSIAANFEIEFEAQFGPNHLAWHADTDHVKPGLRFSGAQRNAMMDVQEFFAIPWERRPRRRDTPPEGARQPSNADPGAFYRWSRGASKGIEIPPNKFAVAPQSAPLNVNTFDSGGIEGGWGFYYDTGSGLSGVVHGVRTDAAIVGTHGYKFKKDLSGWRAMCLRKYVGPDTRRSLALRFRVRIIRLPHQEYCTIASINSGSNDLWWGDQRAYIHVGQWGDMYYCARDRTGEEDWYTLATVKNGDVCDIEIVANGGYTTNGSLSAAIGLNGATRTFRTAYGGQNWSDKRLAWVNVGYTMPYTSGQWAHFDFDQIVVTEFGDALTDQQNLPSTDPLPRVDRPTRPPIYLSSHNFDAGTLPTGVSAVRSPADATKVVNVQTDAAINETHGVRIADTGTAGTACLLYDDALARDWEGNRVRVRVKALPSSGRVRIYWLGNRDGGGSEKMMAAYDLDSAGNLYAVPGTAAGDGTSVLVRAGVQVNQILTLEIVLTGAGATGGMANFWYSVGGTGAPAERSLYKQITNLDWTGLNFNRRYAGSVSKTVATATITLDVDSLARTEFGENQFAEFDPEGNNIYQANYFLPPGSPARDDLMVQGVRIAVQPGDTHTFAIRCLAVGVEGRAYPFAITALDTRGNSFYLGEVYDSVGGCSGTVPWGDRYVTFTVPDGCYEININSREMASGEWTFQDPAFCDGGYENITRPVTYPAEGSYYHILNTETQGELLWLQPPTERPWLLKGAVGTVPDGCSLTIKMASSDTEEKPAQFYEDFSLVKQAKYLHTTVEATSDPTRKLTPELSAGSPFCDFFTRMAAEPVPTLLRGDFSEFYGGAYVQDIDFPKPESSLWDVRKPQGRAIRHRLTEPIGLIPNGFTVVAFTERAMVEIEKATERGDEFVLEFLGRRYTIKFTDQQGITFSVNAADRRWIEVDGEVTWFARGTASTSDEVEIVSMDPLPGVWTNA